MSSADDDPLTMSDGDVLILLGYWIKARHEQRRAAASDREVLAIMGCVGLALPALDHLRHQLAQEARRREIRDLDQIRDRDPRGYLRTLRRRFVPDAARPT